MRYQMAWAELLRYPYSVKCGMSQFMWRLQHRGCDPNCNNKMKMKLSRSEWTASHCGITLCDNSRIAIPALVELRQFNVRRVRPFIWGRRIFQFFYPNRVTVLKFSSTFRAVFRLFSLMNTVNNESDCFLASDEVKIINFGDRWHISCREFSAKENSISLNRITDWLFGVTFLKMSAEKFLNKKPYITKKSETPLIINNAIRKQENE